MKTKDIRSIYDILENAKLTNLSAQDKLAILKIVRVVKPIAVESREFEDNAREQLKDDRFDTMVQKAITYNTLVTKYGEGNPIPEEENPISVEEHRELVEYFYNFDNAMKNLIDEEDEKDHDITLSTISEDTFNKLVESNPDWDMDVMMKLSDTLIG